MELRGIVNKNIDAAVGFQDLALHAFEGFEVGEVDVPKLRAPRITADLVRDFLAAFQNI